jgi:hypothetical protein
VHAEHDSAGEEDPGDHRPAAGNVDPLLAGVAHHQRAQRKGEGHTESDIPQVEHRRMNHHLGILEQRVQAEAVGGNVTHNQREGKRCEVEQQQEENLDRGKNGGGIGGQANVHLMPQPQYESIRRKQPCP